jgi:hypothetical protein
MTASARRICGGALSSQQSVISNQVFSNQVFSNQLAAISFQQSAFQQSVFSNQQSISQKSKIKNQIRLSFIRAAKVFSDY